MNKKVQKEGKQANNLNKFLGRKQKEEERSTSKQKPKNEGKKKVLMNNNLINNQQKPQSPPPVSKQMALQMHLRQLQMSQILQKCPKIQQLVQSLAVRSGLTEDIVSNLVKKCLESSPSSLWSKSYAPRQISELFNVQAANRIKQWLNAFFQYKNKMVQEDSSFNYIRPEKNDKSYQNIREHSWQLLALIIRGRPGVGKTSAVKAVVKDMDVHIQQCGNDYHQSKYLKEKFESTQSESVKGVCIKKVKVDTKAQMITKFLPTIQKERPKQNKKAQIIHNISKIYPESDAQKFYSELSRCVSLSKIPFILTNSGEKIPKECQKYDIIQYESGSGQKMQKVLWIICHLQSLLVLNKALTLEKEGVFQELNTQLQKLQFKQACKEQKIKQICELYNYRLDYIFTFLQHYRQSLSSINIAQFLLKKFSQINEDQLLEEIQFIDFEKMISHSSQVHSSEKFQDNTQESSQFDKLKDDKDPSLAQLTQKLSLLAIEDTVKQYQETPHSKYKYEPEQWQTHPYICIRNQVHRGIKSSLARMINKEIGYSYERLKSTIKPSQLCYLPMLIRQKRASRSSRVSVETLKKVYDNNQFCYLQQFGFFIKPQ